MLSSAPLKFATLLTMKISVVSQKKDTYTETITIHAKDAATGAPLQGDILIDGVKAGVTGTPLTYTHSSLGECDFPPCKNIRVYPIFTVQVPKYTPVEFVR
jgi:hypothetical protein